MKILIHHAVKFSLVLTLVSMGINSAWAQTATATSCTSSCPSTCAAQNHFGNLAKESLALSQPPNPQTSFSQGCLSNLEGFNLNGFNVGNVGNMLSGFIKNMEKKIMNEACSTLTNTMNNEVSQGNSVLNFALDPQQLESSALNSVSSTVLNAEQGELNTATNAVSNATGTYTSDAGNAENDANSDANNAATSGGWVNNLY